MKGGDLMGQKWQQLQNFLQSLPLATGDRVGLTIHRIKQITGTTSTSIEDPVAWSRNMSQKGTLPPYNTIQQTGYDVAQIELEFDSTQQCHRVKRITLEKR